MTIEASVALFRPGELRLRDVRALLGPDINLTPKIDVLVLGTAGEAPVATTVNLTTVRRGRGAHVAMQCPQCYCPRTVLHAGRGALGCTQCLRQRTAHQTLKRTTWWLSLGGREEDALLRLINRSRSRSALKKASFLAAGLLAADRARVEEAMQKAEAARAMRSP